MNFDFKSIEEEVKDKIVLSDKKCLSYKRAYDAFGEGFEENAWIDKAKKYFSNHKNFKSGRGKGGTIALRESDSSDARANEQQNTGLKPATGQIKSEEKNESVVVSDDQKSESIDLESIDDVNGPSSVDEDVKEIIPASNTPQKRAFFPEEVARETARIEQWMLEAVSPPKKSEKTDILFRDKHFIFDAKQVSASNFIKCFRDESNIEAEQEVFIVGEEEILINKSLVPYIENVLYYYGAARVV